ncbi:hypothetical protein [Planctomyces sp. SH-PL62]|uniref:hypothetical protein n=1 Tax=Planctomyces sp. SH-PL62 TaxID=1636152 RepID=UPI00078E76CE|nr:hypothetical protein [Planctomyces sp. SH-PL62]AMV37077.1 hypothetical protein VT85_06575 [Planctomyces sp. SH-PL62]
MSRRNLMFALVGLVAGLLAATRVPLHAQKPPQDPTGQPLPAPVGTAAIPRAEGKVSLQDALLLPYTFDFGKPTALDAFARRLSADLGGEVVLDIAALDRLELRKEDTVELELKGSRLKTGLKLVLDQVDLTYRIIPEDNLMILTDEEGAEDPLDKIWAELGHVHREVHDILDVLDEVLARVESQDDGPQLRQPTIIEEMPGVPGADPAAPGVDPVPPEEGAEPAPVKRPRT